METMSKFTTLLNNVSSENNEGASLLARGDVHEALKYFYAATKLITNAFKEVGVVATVLPRFLLVNVKSESTLPPKTGRMMTQGQLLPTILVDGKECNPCFYSVLVPSLEAEQQGSGFYIHRKSLILVTDHEMESLSQLLSELCCCHAVILFNIAMSFHWKGKATRESGSLKAAAQFYGRSIQIVDSSRFKDLDYMRMLMIMALNNRAEIYYELRQFHESYTVLDHLTKTLQYPSGDPVADDSRDLRATRLNIMIFSRPSLAPCA